MKGIEFMTAIITPKELAGRKASGQPVALIDVRTTVEFQQIHIDFARNLPLAELTPDKVQNGDLRAETDPLYVICHSGGRGRQACERLRSAGLNAVNVEGGTAAWEAAGLPVVRSEPRIISLERQVRIGAGSLVLAAVLLGSLLNPAFYALAGFVGAGLLFAGLTDWCGMGLLLSRMPWNRVGRTESTGA